MLNYYEGLNCYEDKYVCGKLILGSLMFICCVYLLNLMSAISTTSAEAINYCRAWLVRHKGRSKRYRTFYTYIFTNVSFYYCDVTNVFITGNEKVNPAPLNTGVLARKAGVVKGTWEV